MIILPDYANVIKFFSGAKNRQKTKKQNTETQKTKKQKDKNLVLPKEEVESADLYKPVLNKIMTTRK